MPCSESWRIVQPEPYSWEETKSHLPMELPRSHGDELQVQEGSGKKARGRREQASTGLALSTDPSECTSNKCLEYQLGVARYLTSGKEPRKTQQDEELMRTGVLVGTGPALCGWGN